MWLPEETFRMVLAAAPLISMDLLLRDWNGHLLLGRRKYPPAQGYWFVPGGRILKGESLDTAFERLTRSELGESFSRADSRFLGLFEHHYADSVFGEEISTHYVVLAHELTLEQPLLNLPDEQHAAYAWWTPEEAAASNEVYSYTRQYCK